MPRRARRRHPSDFQSFMSTLTERTTMSVKTRGRFATLAVVVPLLIGLAGCGDDDKEKAKERANAACPSDIAGTASTALPGDVPAPSGARAYSYSSQGKTQVWFFAISGSADQLPALRDAYDGQLTAKGYRIVHTDQEDGAEAEAEFGGPHDGTTNLQPLCQGKVKFRLKLTS
jgi:hypothetical protein